MTHYIQTAACRKGGYGGAGVGGRRHIRIKRKKMYIKVIAKKDAALLNRHLFGDICVTALRQTASMLLEDRTSRTGGMPTSADAKRLTLLL